MNIPGIFIVCVSVYVRGVRVGWVYEGRLGGGYLVGEVDGRGELTGPDLAFIYPDFRTAVRGEYRAGGLVRGRLVSVVSSCQGAGGVATPVYSEPGSDQEYSHDPASHHTISQWPLLR